MPYKKKNKLAIIVGILLIAIAVPTPFVAYFTVCAPADAQFNRQFTSHETMAHDSASFEKMREQIMIIWTNMNSTWNPAQFDTIYNTWWYPDQTYENSLQATNNYYQGLINRIDATIVEMQMIEVGNRTILTPYNQYYTSMLNSFRSETTTSGGLLWAIHDAWYLHFAPMAYWFFIWAVLPEIIAIVVGAILLLYGNDESYYSE